MSTKQSSDDPQDIPASTDPAQLTDPVDEKTPETTTGSGEKDTNSLDFLATNPPIELNDPADIPEKDPPASEEVIEVENNIDYFDPADFAEKAEDPEKDENISAPPKAKKFDKTSVSSPIIIKKIKKHGHGHHGGAWKIAFADFVTAMMAFFLLMWLLAALNKAQKEGLADYFKQPIKVAILGGNSMGDRKESLQGGGSDITQKDGLTANNNKPPVAPQKIPDEAAAKAAELKQLENIKMQLTQSMESEPALMGLKKQLLMDITKDGLRIQLIDDQNRPMFEMGKDEMSPEMQQVLNKIVLLLKDSPNKITIQGHTDANPYDNPEELQTSNWELSTQRANAARRALIKAGLNENKIMRVTGFASTMLLDKAQPLNPKNRRISIIIMKKEAEDNILMDN